MWARASPSECVHTYIHMYDRTEWSRCGPGLVPVSVYIRTYICMIELSGAGVGQGYNPSECVHTYIHMYMIELSGAGVGQD